MAAQLRAIEGPASPEADLRRLFRREREAERELARIRVEQAVARRRYALAHGLLALPGMDTLRRLFG